ncbi:MAG: c-type cytochrome [Deltaproteobacteria bacterium]|nr:c-type cytochrome [Deltaproteobacteria bacterium]
MVRGVFLLSAALAWAALGANAAFAEGDVAAGKKVFKRCLVCHTDVEGKHKTGPTLHEVLGRAAGTAKGFRYSPAYVRAGKEGLVWKDETLFEYLRHPKKFLRKFLKDPKVKSRMTMKYFKEKDRRDVIEYMKSLGN